MGERHRTYKAMAQGSDRERKLSINNKGDFMSRALKETGPEDVQFVWPKEILAGKKEISGFVGRGWRVVSRWIKERGFPATKIDGRWESNADLIQQWHKDQVAKESEN